MIKNFSLFSCLLFNFLYLFSQGCTQPYDPITDLLNNPKHHSVRVPHVLNLQASVGQTQSGTRMVLLAWAFDTTNANLRSWDVYRSVNDTTTGNFAPMEIVRKPVSGFPTFPDTTSTLQALATDSLNLYYKVIPNGADNFVGPASDVLHIVFRKEI